MWNWLNRSFRLNELVERLPIVGELRDGIRRRDIEIRHWQQEAQDLRVEAKQAWAGYYHDKTPLVPYTFDFDMCRDHHLYQTILRVRLRPEMVECHMALAGDFEHELRDSRMAIAGYAAEMARKTVAHLADNLSTLIEHQMRQALCKQ